MSIKLTKRVASSILGRGETSIRIREGSLEDAKKAITRDDVRGMIKSGAIYAIKKKREVFKRSEPAKRKRGTGKRKGTNKARLGGSPWKKKARSQRALLKKLREMRRIDGAVFRKYYLLVKGNTFPDKRSLLLHLEDEGIKVSEDELKQINEYIRGTYR
jgi:large subunit ribosomal protein L19e